jgi:hypothetical protein
MNTYKWNPSQTAANCLQAHLSHVDALAWGDVYAKLN